MLNRIQNNLRLDVTQDMLECTNNDLDFMKTVIIELSWVYMFMM